MKTLTLQEMLEIGRKAAEKYGDQFEKIGIRLQDRPEIIGAEITWCSRVWVDGEETDEYLPGVSAIDAHAKHLTPHELVHCHYPGEYVVVLGSNFYQYGVDPGEIIMIDPVVLDCWRL